MTVKILDTELKEATLATYRDYNTVLKCAHKNKEKIERLQMFDFSSLLGKHILWDDIFQDTFFLSTNF